MLATAALLAWGSPASAEPKLQVGVGRADITPPTGYYMMGWVRSDGVITGQHTRLWARVIVLEQGDQKLALVSEDLNGIPGGMMAAAADRVRELGFSERNVLDSASHTHAAPTGFYNFPTYNTVFMTLDSPTDFDLTGTLDPQLYAFQVRQLALALRRANADLAPGALGWGEEKIAHLTKNRSLEAHLYDHGIHEPYGAGDVSQDPKGYLHTIDPQASVLRVDKVVGGRDVPVGIWSTFANHGTVNKFQFTYYNEDHHGAATHLVERAIRRAGGVPKDQDVVNVYGNTDEGDQSSGLDRSGPAAAAEVGTEEARRFLTAWRAAGRYMDRTPALGRRWTRMCFCGQDTAAGPVADKGVFGQAEFTGSEEGRGPLFDITGVPFEGDHLPAGHGTQGNKIQTPIPLDIPTAVPLMALRIDDRMIVSIPGEMTAEMGRRVRHAVVAAARGSGVTNAVISGLANEYADYFTTPQEYDAQHYEGAATVYGRASSVALQETLVKLTDALVADRKGPKAYPYDPRNGVSAKAEPFSTGAKDGEVVGQPGHTAERLEHPAFSWQGGPRGYDRPVDEAFVRIQRRGGGGWRTVESDLGLDVLWSVDSSGVYRAEWEPTYDHRLGTYRFRITANRYGLTSRPFDVRPSRALRVSRVSAPPGKVGVVLEYPKPEVNEGVGDPPPDADAGLTPRPDHVLEDGAVTFVVDGRRRTVTAGPDGRFQVRAAPGQNVEIPAGGGHDGLGNRTGGAVAFTA
ncbi:MAG: neutral/alkaline non-lysosomal ceramidase N-terminal domain-containing protein [Candidatus Limnocylindria bacterium]